MKLSQQLEDQLLLAHWIDQHFRVDLPITERSYLSIACFDVTIEYHAAMLLLGQAELYGSMFSLVRVAFESLARGLWLRYCASEYELRQFEKGTVAITFGTLVDRVEATLGLPNGPLSKLKANSWRLMNSLTHTGIDQVRARHSATTTGSNYTPESVSQALDLAGTLALLAATELASYAERPELVKLVKQKTSDYAVR